MQMNVTNPSFTGKVAYTKEGNPYHKSNTYKQFGFGLGVAVVAGTAAFENKELIKTALKKENLQAAGTAVVDFFKSIPAAFKKVNKESIKGAANKVGENVSSVASSVKNALKFSSIKKGLKTLKEAVKNIDYKSLGKFAGKASVIALPVIVGVVTGALVDKLVDKKRADLVDGKIS